MSTESGLFLLAYNVIYFTINSTEAWLYLKDE